MKKGYIYIVLFVFLSCKNKEENRPNNFIQATQEEKQETYHEDSTYKYEYRTDNSQDYQYNYDVSGYDDSGNEVTGNVFVECKYGNGTISDSDGNELDVEVEWIDYGKLKATDDDGNEYELEVD